MENLLVAMPLPGRMGRLLPSILLFCWLLMNPQFTTAQTLQTVSMAIPSKSFQMAIYPIAQQKGYMKEKAWIKG
jgi:hypothetical protein